MPYCAIRLPASPIELSAATLTSGVTAVAPAVSVSRSSRVAATRSRSETTAHRCGASSSSVYSKTKIACTPWVAIIRATTRSGVSGGQLMTPWLIASPTVPVSKGTGRSSPRCSTYTMRRYSSHRRAAASG